MFSPGRLFLDDPTKGKMKFLVAFALAVACAHADVSHVVNSADYGATILKSESETKPDGFQYALETSNGIYASATGSLKNINAENPAQVVQGEFSYPADDGKIYKTVYTADENGYQPQGEHLPTPHPIPELIQRSLEYIAAHPQPESAYSGARAQASAYVAPAAPARQVNKFARRP